MDQSGRKEPPERHLKRTPDGVPEVVSINLRPFVKFQVLIAVSPFFSYLIAASPSHSAVLIPFVF